MVKEACALHPTGQVYAAEILSFLNRTRHGNSCYASCGAYEGRLSSLGLSKLGVCVVPSLDTCTVDYQDQQPLHHVHQARAQMFTPLYMKALSIAG